MDTQLIQIRDQQKEIWNRFSPSWKKWDDLSMDFLKPVGDEIIRLIKPKGVDVVLDVASGTGEPGLTIATRLNGGMVVMADLSEEMLGIAREKAARRGIKNIQIITSDVSSLPFPDNSFDSVTCRFGYMFFPDMQLATREMARVLKPGGRIAVSVWNVAEKNFWGSGIMNIINRDMHLGTPPQDAPGLFRCAKPGMMAGFFRKAGLKNISEKEIGGKLQAGTTEQYWKYMTEVAIPVVAALRDTDESIRAKIKNEVFEAINKKYPIGKVAIESSALVIYGEK